MKEIIKLLKSGNFTIRYDDNGSGEIIEGRFKKYEDTYNEDTGEPNGKSYSFGGNSDGYISDIVEWLTKALGGKTTSI